MATTNATALKSDESTEVEETLQKRTKIGMMTAMPIGPSTRRAALRFFGGSVCALVASDGQAS